MLNYNKEEVEFVVNNINNICRYIDEKIHIIRLKYSLLSTDIKSNSENFDYRNLEECIEKLYNSGNALRELLSQMDNIFEDEKKNIEKYN